VTVYSVYEPPSDASDIVERADRLAFVKEGFSWPAFLVPILWLLYYRMWLEFVFLALAYVALQLVFGTDAQGQTLFGWASLAIAVLFAFEANDLRAASLERRGYRLAGVASGRDRTEAERSFFAAWLPRQVKTVREAERVPEPRRGLEPVSPMPRSEGEEVIGLFPRP
jgi:signal transduction histidine kinase